MSNDDYANWGFAFRDLVYGLDKLKEGRQLSALCREAFGFIKTLIEDSKGYPRNREPFLEYDKSLEEKGLNHAEFDSKLIKVLTEKDLSHFEEGELDQALEVFKHMANYYILKMQGVRVD